MELHLINCYFSIFSFEVPIKINKNTTNAYTYYEKYSKQYNAYCAETAFTRTTYFFIFI